MFAILPIKTSIQPQRTPYANYFLIGLNVLIFALTYWPHNTITGAEESLRFWAEQFMLTPLRPYLWQFVTYAFLHGGFIHLIGNMYFLYLFGNNVNDKLGNVGYTCFFLAGAVFSGIGHTLLHNNPVLGASGAVAAVTGAYLVLFPQTLITVVYWVIFIGRAEFSALWFIGFKLIVWDNYVEPLFSTHQAIAYDAHLAGYAFGVIVILLMLASNLLDRNYADLFSMIKQGNRRRKYRDTVTQGYDPYRGHNLKKKINVRQKNRPSADDIRHAQTTELRNKTITLIAQKNLADAAQCYLELVEIDSRHVLPRQNQLDIANQLMSMGKWEGSALAYEKMLEYYDSSEYIEQIQLMLGVLYSRYLDKPELALKFFEAAKSKLIDPTQKKMCEEELEKLKNKQS